MHLLGFLSSPYVHNARSQKPKSITMCVIVVTVRKHALFIAVPEHQFSIIDA